MSPETRNCQNCKQDFVIEPEDFDFYKKMDVPPPTFCWMCRAQRRMVFRNERALFKRTSDLSGKEIFATYPTDVPFPVYTQEEWYSDQWNPLDYGREYDFSRSFFEQFKELSDSVPKPAKSVSGFLKNSDFSNNAGELKNCYLVFNASWCEDCAYGNALERCNFCFDNSNIGNLELSYENFDCLRSSKVFFSVGIVDSTDIYFSKDLRACRDCFGCINLRGKSYYIFNKPYSKEDYFKTLHEFNIGSYSNLREIRKRAADFWKKFPNKFREDGSKSVNISGEYIYNSKNAHQTYQAVGAEDIKYCQYANTPPVKDCYDFTIYGDGAERFYECAMAGGQSRDLRFCLQTYSGTRNLEYCEYCTMSSDLFGCVSLKNGQYCVLNKQYSKEEYEELVPRIRRQMMEIPYLDRAGREYRYGEFFPAEFSYFGYNETIAQEHFPLSKEESLDKKFDWRDIKPKNHTVTKPFAELPDGIGDMDDSILDEIIGCEHEGKCEHGCTGAFRVIRPELEFYRRFNIAMPRICVNCRHRERLKNRNSVRLWTRNCACRGLIAADGKYENTIQHFHGSEPCSNEFETAYAPDRPEILYCEQCYNAEVA